MGYGRKISGGKYHKFSKKKKYALRGIERKVGLRETRKKIIRGIGGNKRTVLLSSNIANVMNLKTKKSQETKIKNVLETFLYTSKDKGPKAELVVIAVLDKYQGQGIGKILTRTLLPGFNSFFIFSPSLFII